MRKLMLIASFLAVAGVACGGGAGTEDIASPAGENQLVVGGMGMQMVVSPVTDGIVTGEVTVSVPTAPEDAASVWFGLVPEDKTIEDVGPNLGAAVQGSDGWQFTFNSAQREDGRYTLVGMASNSARPEKGVPPLAFAQTEIVIANGSPR